MSQILQLPMDKQTELMLKYGPKDTCWAANWGEKDEALLQKYFIKSATLGRENNPMITDFFDQLEKKWNDHTGLLEIDGKRFEITQISKTSDIVTIQGLQYCCRVIAEAGSMIVFQWHGVGSSTIEPRAYQQRLFAETTPRSNMAAPATGSMTRSNQSARYVGIFAASFPTITVTESAVFLNQTGYTGPMLNRQVFQSNPITHTVNVAPFTVGTDVTFASVTTYG